jgi:hypothetical protein
MSFDGCGNDIYDLMKQFTTGRAFNMTDSYSKLNFTACHMFPGSTDIGGLMRLIYPSWASIWNEREIHTEWLLTIGVEEAENN